MQQAWTPYKFKIFAEDPEPAAFFRSIFTYYMAGMLYLWVGLSLWAPDLLRAMTTPEFHPAWSIIWAVCLMRVMQAVYPMMATGIELSSNTRAVPLTSAAGLLTAILTAVPLIDRYGAIGAAFATALAWGTVGVAFYFVAQRQIYIRYDLRTIAALAIVAAVLIFLGYEAQSLALWLRLTLFAVLSLVYPLLAFLILMRSETERHRMEIIKSKLSSIRRSRGPKKKTPVKPESTPAEVHST
jgi:O-antigen/teichoic acid export membrane protein